MLSVVLEVDSTDISVVNGEVNLGVVDRRKNGLTGLNLLGNKFLRGIKSFFLFDCALSTFVRSTRFLPA